MRLGVCYYPEHWPEERWVEDARQMEDLGLQVVRIGEFAWSALEPERDRFEWDWLDRAIDTLAAAGLDVVLGTPTATPPAWLTAERPEVLLTGPDGRRRPHGSRRHTCPTSAAYRQEARRIVTHLVARYAGRAAAWQVDNEPGNHDSARCWCDECQAAFTAWLTDRYGDVDRLNGAWGTVFWSQTYPSLDAVRLPAPTSAPHNPALLLAHRRFASHQVVAGLAEQFEIITAGDPGRPVTTNLFLGDLDPDAHEVAALGGLSSFDNYPHGTSGWEETAYVLDLGGGAAEQAWVMEQQAGHINWTAANPAVPPGQVRVWTWQAAQHGIDTLLYFRWRAARRGQEQYHSAILDHDGTPTAAADEFRRVAAELAAARLPARRATAAVLHSYGDAWAIDIDPHRKGLTHRTFVLAAHAAARRLGYDVDVVPPTADLTGYELVLAPALHLATPGRLGRLSEALDAGSLVVLGPRSLTKDDDNAWVDVPQPAGLTDRLGARVGGFAPLGEPAALFPDGRADDWAEALAVDGAEVVARWADGPYVGRPAAARNGNLAYLGAGGTGAWLAVLGRLTGRPPLPPGVETGRSVTIDHGALSVGFD